MKNDFVLVTVLLLTACNVFSGSSIAPTEFHPGFDPGPDTSTTPVIPALPSPSVTAVSPAAGTAVGGTTLTITGTNFRSGLSVTINGVSCSSPTVSAVSLTCVNGANASIVSASVVVTNSDGTSGVLSNGYMYLGTPVLWIHAGAGISATANLVDTWSDQSGNGNDGTGVGVNRPTYVASAPLFKNYPVIRFAGSHWFTLARNDVLNSVAGASYFYAGSTTAVGTVQSVAYYDKNGGTTARLKVSISQSGGPVGSSPSGDLAVGGRRLDADAFQFLNGGTIVNNTPYTTSATVDYVSRAVNLTMNNVSVSTYGAFQTSGVTSAGNSNAAFVGQSGAAVERFQGDLAELLLYASALSSADRSAVEDYLQRKYILP